MSKKKNTITTFIIVLMLVSGLCLTLYPSFSNWWNARLQTRAIIKYDQTVSQMDNAEKERIIAKAEEYNRKLAELSDPLGKPKEIAGYEDILDITGTGIMGYITIPKINVYLPVYHGTSAEVLNVAVGHLQGTTLPIGGNSRHAVISAHRGLPSAKLFTDIDQLVEDDTFTITILDEVLTYEIDQIETILPSDTEKLRIQQDMDCVTLMTCTPYGINTHRLLVRGRRIDTVYPRNVRVPADAVMVDDMTVWSAIVVFVLLLLLIWWFISEKLRGSRRFTQEKVYDIPLRRDK